MGARAGLCSTTPDPVCPEEAVSLTPTWEKRPLPAEAERDVVSTPPLGKQGSEQEVTGNAMTRKKQGWLSPTLLLEIHSVSCLPGQGNINSAGGFPFHPFRVLESVLGFWNLYWGKFQG